MKERSSVRLAEVGQRGRSLAGEPLSWQMALVGSAGSTGRALGGCGRCAAGGCVCPYERQVALRCCCRAVAAALAEDPGSLVCVLGHGRKSCRGEVLQSFHHLHGPLLSSLYVRVCCAGEHRSGTLGMSPPVLKPHDLLAVLCLMQPGLLFTFCRKSTLLSHAQLSQTPFLPNCFLSGCLPPYTDA